MTIGGVLDYIDEYLEMKSPNKKEKIATYGDEVPWL